MGVIRLIVLAILFYFGWLLIRGIMGKFKTGDSAGADEKADGNSPAQDELVEDPVCHTFIPKGQSVQLHHDKKMYYFCSDKCCEMFLKQKGAEE